MEGVGLLFSHICFADDLILVAEANRDQVLMFKNILDEFCYCSEQKVNLSKSKVYFSPNLSSSIFADLSLLLGVEETKDLGQYLGASMMHQIVSKHSFSFMLDKMRKKLVMGKVNFLLFAGRVTLAQSCLASIPGYVMQTVAIPISICDEAEKICRISFGEA